VNKIRIQVEIPTNVKHPEGGYTDSGGTIGFYTQEANCERMLRLDLHGQESVFVLLDDLEDAVKRIRKGLEQ